MSLRQTNSYRRQIESVFEKARDLDDIEMQAQVAKYLCVLTSGLIEVAIREILSEYAKDKSHQRISNFISNQVENITNLNFKKVCELVHKFDPLWKDALETGVDDEMIDAVNSVVGNRHLIAHGRPVGVSFVSMKNWYRNVSRFIEVLDTTCR